MTYWWVTPWIITFFVLFIMWTAIWLSSAKDWFVEREFPFYIWITLFFAWFIPCLAKLMLDIVIPIFLAFWFSFKP